MSVLTYPEKVIPKSGGFFSSGDFFTSWEADFGSAVWPFIEYVANSNKIKKQRYRLILICL
jgi:hypothetical protein